LENGQIVNKIYIRENNTIKELDYLWIKIGRNDIIISQLRQIWREFVEK